MILLAEPISISKFMAGWLPTAAVAATVNPAPRLADAFAFAAGGITIPPVTCGLGLLGILLARPLAKRRETIGWPLFVLVSVIMLIVVQLWIIESRPGALFAFVIAIGLGFSGYSLIELVGAEMGAFIKRIVAIPTGSIGVNGGNSDKTNSGDPKP